MQMKPAFDDQGGFVPRTTGTSFSLDPLGRLPPRLDPRLAPQKADFLQKSSPQKGGAGQATLFTYGLPSSPVDQSAGRNSTRYTPGGPNQGTGRVAARTSLPPPAPSGLTPWQLRRRQQNEMLLSNPRIRAFLDMISHSEGDTNYRSLFGNHHQTFTDQSTHPGNHGQNYRGRPGGAAGRYQIMPVTYRNLNKLLGPYSMSDHDQDLMAVELIREGNALLPLVSGPQPDLATAVSRLGQRRTWTSFPVLGNGSWQSNPSGQPTRNFEDLQRSFSGALDQARRRLGYR